MESEGLRFGVRKKAKKCHTLFEWPFTSGMSNWWPHFLKTKIHLNILLYNDILLKMAKKWY